MNNVWSLANKEVDSVLNILLKFLVSFGQARRHLFEYAAVKKQVYT